MDSPVAHLVDRRLEREKDTAARRDKITYKNCQGSREAVRKRTFTQWINTHLKKFDPSMQVDDLYTDVQDGKILMALLEELSGCKMLHRFRPSTHRIFTISNIAKVLEFLEDRNARVMSMEAADVADGKPSVILALIWTIIVYFQLKEVTGSLGRRFSSSVSSLVSLADSSDSARSSPVPSSDEHCSTLPSKRKRESRQPKYYRSRAISTLLNWTQTCTAPYGVEVQDFGKSWRNGLAFLALVKCARPESVDMTAALTSTPRENLTQAFRAAQHCLGIPPLLDPEDVMMRSPDEQSVITYVSQFLQRFPQIRDDDTLMFPGDKFSPITDYSDSELSSTSLGFEDFSDFTQKEPNQEPGSYCCLSSTAEEEEFSQSNGQYLHSSIERHCWSSLPQKKILETYGGLAHGSEEGIHILPALDSEEEDAYSYILELDDEELSPSNELEKCSAPINAQKSHHDLLGDLQHNNGERHHICPSSEIQKPSLQLSSESSRETHEEHISEGDVSLKTNKTDVHHRQGELAIVTPTGPDLCTQKDHLNLKHTHNITNIHNHITAEPSVSESHRTLIRSDSPSKDEGLHSLIFSNTDNQSLSMMSLTESSLIHEDELNEVKEPVKNSLSDDSPQSRNFTHQTNLCLSHEEPSETPSTLESSKDLSVTVLGDAMNSDLLHTVLLLWILTYCIFMLPQIETWTLF
uniref:Calmin n=1 Tax=Astyanax mexicanus TaxID=7994 RepID=A0A3B1IPN8_ASTMX